MCFDLKKTECKVFNKVIRLEFYFYPILLRLEIKLKKYFALVY